MFAVVDIAGSQFKVAANDKLHVPLLKQEKGASVTFDKVLMFGDEKNVKIGNPTVKGASVSATVLEHVKADKVFVFKKKRRKGYRVKKGHRQDYTKIEITNIVN
jgi:large subunit ribosomal protein L21